MERCMTLQFPSDLRPQAKNLQSQLHAIAVRRQQSTGPVLRLAACDTRMLEFFCAQGCGLDPEVCVTHGKEVAL